MICAPEAKSSNARPSYWFQDEMRRRLSTNRKADKQVHRSVGLHTMSCDSRCTATNAEIAIAGNCQHVDVLRNEMMNPNQQFVSYESHQQHVLHRAITPKTPTAMAVSPGSRG